MHCNVAQEVVLIVFQEIRNITWIAECIAQNQKERIGNYISVF